MLDETVVLQAVRAAIRTAMASAPWPPALTSVTNNILTGPHRALGGFLTRWAMTPLYCCAAICGDWRRALPAAVAAELCGAATDLLDEVEDGDASEALDRYGAPIALNAATALLMHALGYLAATPAEIPGAGQRAQEVMRDGLSRAMGGQHLDLSTAGAEPLDVAA